MFKKLSTLQRILICVGLANFFEFCLVYFLVGHYAVGENDYSFISAITGFVNFIWIFFLLRKSFNVVQNVAVGLNSMVSKHAIEYREPSHLENAGHQKEVTELVDAFNHLVDDIHDNAEKSKNIITSVNNNGD